MLILKRNKCNKIRNPIEKAEPKGNRPCGKGTITCGKRDAAGNIKSQTGLCFNPMTNEMVSTYSIPGNERDMRGVNRIINGEKYYYRTNGKYVNGKNTIQCPRRECSEPTFTCGYKTKDKKVKGYCWWPEKNIMVSTYYLSKYDPILPNKIIDGKPYYLRQDGKDTGCGNN